MVFVEEIEDDEPVAAPPKTVAPAPEAVAAEAGGKPKSSLKSGFLSNAAPLYPPEGSPEGVVADETHKAHMEHDMNNKMNDGMNRGAKDNNGCAKPQWFNSEWPSGCQYNSPGCDLDELGTTEHASEIHRNLVQRGERWEEALSGEVASLRLSFMSLTDEDLATICGTLKGNDKVTEIDLSHNRIKDKGVQTLVGALAGGAAPNLKELRLYRNEFSELGTTMVTQGLAVLRKKIVVQAEEPAWMLAAAEAAEQKAADTSGLD